MQVVLAGIFRGDGNIKGIFDPVFNPWMGPIAGTPSAGPFIFPSGLPFLRAGVKGLFLLALGAANPWQIPCMIVKSGEQTVVEGKVEFSVDITFSGDVGPYIYPFG
jgi:hypothetical protein